MELRVHLILRSLLDHLLRSVTVVGPLLVEPCIFFSGVALWEISLVQFWVEAQELDLVLLLHRRLQVSLRVLNWNS